MKSETAPTQVRGGDADDRVQPVGSLEDKRAATSGGLAGMVSPSRRAWLFAWLAFIPFVFLRAGTLAESDTFWQVRTGLLTIHQRRIPTVDTFSWTVHGRPWTLNSWGFNVVLAAAYRLAGLPGVALACAALVAATGGLVLLLARRLGASPTVAGMSLVLLVAPLLTVYFSARPQLIDYVAVLALVLLLRGIVEAQASMWSLVALGGLTIGWVNLHAGALLGVAIVGATTVVVFARRSTRNRSGWCLAALVTVTACTLVNPYGIGIVSQTMQVKQASQGVITEWQHLDPANPMQLITFAAGLIALVVAARRRDVVFTAALAVAAAGAVTAIRILPVLLLLSAPMLAVYASQPPVLRYLRSRRTMLAQGSALGLAVIVVLAGLALSHAGRADPSDYPGAVVHAIPKHCRVFNSYLIGGYVILERPDVAVSLDSRNDLYGAQRVLLAQRVLAGQGDPDHELAGAGCVLVPPTSGLAHRLAGRDGWTLKAAETGAALYVRN